MSDIKAIGVIRRMDNLGRVVIPKEVRQMVLHVNEGDPVEFYVQDNSVIIKKAGNPVQNLLDVLEENVREQVTDPYVLGEIRKSLRDIKLVMKLED